MRQLKNLMKAKKPMWRCGECKCVTLQAWKCADEFCGCGEWENSPTAKYTFKDWDWTILKTGVVNDLETPIPPENPTRESTAQYDYTFTGWKPKVKKITKDTTYTAKYEESVRSYTVTIAANDATMWTVDESSLIVEYWTAISENNNVLTIDTVDVTATAEAWYSFSSWTDSDWNALPATITWDITIIANFTV